MLKILGLCILAALFAASCANLPSKVVPEQMASTPAPVNDIPDVSLDNSGDETQLIRNPQSDVQPEPQSDATVTPVVLFVEKKGDTEAVVVRDVPAVEFYSDGTV